MNSKSAKYHNPDAPLGYIQLSKPEVRYKEGIEVNGVHCQFLGTILHSGIFELDDCRRFTQLNIDSSDEEGEIIAVDSPSENTIKKEVVDDDRTVANEKKDDDDDDDNSSAVFVSSKTIKKEPNDENSKRIKSKAVDRLSKRAYSDNYNSDSSGHSSSYSRYRKSKKKYSRSPSPQYYEETRIKEEPPEQSQYLFGHYPCEICHITMNSLATFKSHISGKRHIKNMKAKNVSESVAMTIPNAPTEGMTKYPKPPSGIYRMKVKTRAKIQDVIETQVKTPCPGLNKVTEIQGIAEVQYYCSMCDSICSPNSIIPHLTGYKHQLKSLKYFKPGIYEDISYEPKYKIEKEILSILSAVQRTEGLGRMAVEKEVLTCNPRDIGSNESQPSTSRDVPSTSFQDSGMPFTDYYNMTTVPDTSKSDFYCKICESHMNSSAMWEQHIRGKRHLTNIKKMPGALPSKTRTIPVPNAHAYLLERLEGIAEPIVGLNQIQEIQIPETKSETYQCFLCGACLTSLDIIEHLLQTKHRIKYLEHIGYPGMEVLVGMREPTACTLIAQMCAEVEAQEGRGNPTVHVTKSAVFQ